MLRRISTVQELDEFVVHADQFGKLPGGQRLRQHVTAQSLLIGQPHAVIDFRHRFVLRNESRFLFVRVTWNVERHHVFGTEIVVYHILRNLIFV